uniref:Ras and EF-hand domain-containing protein-like n=1 Tax=Stegastes partitus TaxID=144197 RepID=A0A3B4ZYL2_9TELE
LTMAELRRLFSACDVNKSGAIEYEDFTVVCRELGVPEAETQTLFDKFDASELGYIDFNRFASRFQEVSETLNLASFGSGASQSSGSPWEEFVSRIDADLREQLADLYQAIHSSANMTLLQPYEEIIHALINQSLDNRMECEQLETSLRRAEELNNSQLAELEDDIQQQLARTEERVREEERKKMEGITATMQRKHENEVADLNAAVDRLLKVGENEQLRGSLVQAQTNIAILHSELDKLKNMYADQKAQHERETEDLKRMVMEYQSYSSQIQILQEMNQKLYDSNDGLRSALASEVVAGKRRLSPQNEIPARRMKPLRESTLNHGSKTSYSHVATWADKYLDSGVSLPMDTAEISGSDYDSDDSRSSAETVHHSYSYVPSDVEISEVKSEAAVSMTPSRTSSIASSLRRRLSAFSTKPLEADIEETEEPAPMYRLVLAGDAGAGKSSFLLRLTLNEFRGDIQTTLGVDFQIKRMLVDGEKTSLQIWDTAGQERFRSIARSYFRKAHGILLLYDVSSESSFLNVRAWVDQIQVTMPGLRGVCAYGALFCETSAKEGTNVVEAVLHLAREVKKNVKLRRQSDSQVRLSQNNPKKTLNSCCGL